MRPGTGCRIRRWPARSRDHRQISAGAGRGDQAAAATCRQEGRARALRRQFPIRLSNNQPRRSVSGHLAPLLRRSCGERSSGGAQRSRAGRGSLRELDPLREPLIPTFSARNRRCEKLLEPETYRIVFSIVVTGQKLAMQLVSASTKLRPDILCANRATEAAGKSITIFVHSAAQRSTGKSAICPR